MPLRERLARLVPGTVARLRPGQDAAFVDAAREAYRAAARDASLAVRALEAAEKLAPAPRAESAPDLAPAASPSTWVTRGPARPEPPAALPDEGPARRRRPRPGETAPDHLLRAPGSVGVATDDFLDGLIRRIEGDR